MARLSNGREINVGGKTAFGKDLIFVSSIQDEGTKLVSLSNDENQTLKSINSQFDLVLLSYKTGLYMAYNGYNFYIVKKDNGK